MELRQRLYDIDELWELYCQPGNDHMRYELIDGVLIEMSGPGGRHGKLAVRLGRYLDIFAEENDLGIVTVESGYHPPGDRHTLLLPDLAFIGLEKAPEPFPERFVPVMPDLAVEIQSPSNTMTELRNRAKLYFQLGTTLVWIVMPAAQCVEVHRAQTIGVPQYDTLRLGDTLNGEDVLPGFALELNRLFH